MAGSSLPLYKSVFDMTYKELQEFEKKIEKNK